MPWSLSSRLWSFESVWYSSTCVGRSSPTVSKKSTSLPRTLVASKSVSSRDEVPTHLQPL